MKRSSKVALTLLIPAMTAFGCSQKPVQVVNDPTKPNATTCDQPAQPGEPPKQPCVQPATPGSNNYRTTHTYHSSYGARPFFWGNLWGSGPSWGSGSSSTGHTTSGHSLGSSGHSTSGTSSGIAHGSSSSHSSTGHVSSGGFGHTSSHFSGGS